MLNSANRTLNKCEEWLMVISMALITVLITLQVVLRYVFATSIPWAEEITRFIVVWMSFIGAAMGVRFGSNISLDLLITVLPQRLHRVLLALVALCGMAFGIALGVFGYPIVMTTAQIGQVSSAMQVPMWWVYLVFPVGGALLTLRYGQMLFDAAWGREPRQPDEDGVTGPLPGA